MQSQNLLAPAARPTVRAKLTGRVARVEAAMTSF